MSLPVGTQKTLLYGFFAFCVLAVLVGMNRGGDRVPTPAAESRTPVPVFSGTVTARAWGVFSPETGLLYAGAREYEAYPIASVTKLVAAAVVLSDPERDSVVRITEADLAAYGRSGRLAVNNTFTRYELLFPLLLESSNDAASALERARGIESYQHAARDVLSAAGVQAMQIVDASGLSEENTAPVTDLAQWYAYMKAQYPHALDITRLRAYVGTMNAYQNNNPARTLEMFRGGKQGYTDAAGYTFLGEFSADDQDTSFGIVILGSTDLLGDIQTLRAYGNTLGAHLVY